MLRRSFHISSKVVRWLLSLTGALALLLSAMIATSLTYPPPLDSIEKTAKAFDHTGVPDISHFQARDGSVLAYRFYPAAMPDSGRAAILFHGSSASGIEMHTLAKALAAHGIGAYAIDIRGHGASGTRGDIGYIGQLEDDVADFVHVIREKKPDGPIVLIGHSSGGGFALRVASSPIQTLFSKTILLAPYLGYRAPTSRPDAGGWAKADLPRAIAIALLERFGITCCGALPTLAFAVPTNSKTILTAAYSYRLMTNYATHRDFRDDIAATSKPIVIFAGAADELMIADRYASATANAGRPVAVHLLPAINHMAIVSDPAATAAITAEAIAD